MHIIPPIEALHVRALCSDLVPGGEPIAINHQPRLDRPTRECFPIVEEQINTHGGSMITGWAIWEWPGLFVEAEFHAIWADTTGALLDLTPNPLNPAHIVFLPDPGTRYEGRQIDNVRKPLVKDNDLVRFLFIFRRQFEILNKGDLAFQHGAISLPPKAHKELLSLQKEGARLERRLKVRYPGPGI